MNSKQKRAEIKRILGLLEDRHRETFVLMYSPTDSTKDVYLVVDDLDSKKLSWALVQCQNSYYRIFEILKT